LEESARSLEDHSGIVWNCRTEALARWAWRGRTRCKQDFAGRGCRCCSRPGTGRLQDFLTLWKDADPDIPILKQAKAEYARLQ